MTGAQSPAIVGVILSRADLRRAVALRIAPDLFEVRLDALVRGSEGITGKLGQLRAPLIITARHPREGGLNHLRLRERRNLLLRFMPHAACVDVELRSAHALAGVLKEARARNIGVIVSFHDFRGTPTAARFEAMVCAAQSLGADLLKIATRSDSPAQLARLRDFYWRHHGKIEMAVMGIGKLGRRARLEFAAAGSSLNYAHLGTPNADGQLSIAELRRTLAKRPGPLSTRPNAYPRD